MLVFCRNSQLNILRTRLTILKSELNSLYNANQDRNLDLIHPEMGELVRFMEDKNIVTKGRGLLLKYSILFIKFFAQLGSCGFS